MDKLKIARINELARKSRTETLSAEEREEQAALRAEYIAAIRGSLTATMESTYIQQPDGSRIKVTRKSQLSN